VVTKGVPKETQFGEGGSINKAKLCKGSMVSERLKNNGSS